MIELSIVIPTYKSAEFIKLTLTEVYKEVSKHIHEFEIVVVNDGNDDNVTSKVMEFKKKFEKVTLLILDKNYGQQVATHIGIKHSKGLYIITLDDDLQFNPADIILMYNAIKENHSYDICCGYPIKKIKKGTFFSISYTLVNFFINYVFFPSNRNTYFFTSFKIYNRSLHFENNKFLYKNIYYFWEFDRSRIKHIFVSQRSRISGNSGYGFIKLIKFAKHLFLKILTKINCILPFLIGIIYYCNFISMKALLILISLSIFLQFILNYWLKKIRYLGFKTKSVQCL